ncbi:transcriptional regulator, Crp/Fnr family [Burkholderia sp. WP9]|uniref:helix-turn-helix domain-containing protein n=1 Tax=Burkholderia sp. WP9 TaxID=1500263 RepID=UPI00089C99FB|nr:helix-turn-helix domain-containing protein [Burkholderia sp. WP9]SEC96642.1 transcriptional regulator, Crp/Fnr family [Burkholderia sp. WP9]
MTFDWHALYDDVKRLGEFGSDAQLAESLGLTRAQISAWRTGKSDLGTLTKLKILDALGHDQLRSAVLSLLPEQNRDELAKQHLVLTERVSRGMQARDRAAAPSSDVPPPREANQLLAHLPDEERERIMQHLTPVSLPLGKVVYEPGERLTQVYLPTTAIISMLHVMENGESAEIAVVGNDGLLGVAVFMGSDTVSNRAVVQNAGDAYCLSAQFAKEEFARGGYIRRLFLRYAQALITQMAQTAVCNRHHSIAQQFCRWLLLSLDRLDSSELQMTQELIANMLGVRRGNVTEIAKQLEATGAIRYNRGHIEVIDRAALEQQVCECYGVVTRECERLYSAA